MKHNSFPPVVDDRTTVLILGTMPGALSLEMGEYYAQPRNRFWQIAEEIAGLDSTAPYDERLDRLALAGFGLWDTLESCEREGSLDSKIRNAEPNDFEELLGAYPAISVIALNGGKAAHVFRRRIVPVLPKDRVNDLRVEDLPSTSPANTRWGFKALLERWRILEHFDPSSRLNAG